MIFLNGNYYEEREAGLKAFDRGFLFGDGIFTTIKVEDSVPLYLDKHIERLQSSSRFLGINFFDPGFPEVIARLLKANGRQDARVKIIVTRGYDYQNRVLNYEGGTPTIAVLMFPPVPDLSHAVTLGISPEMRGNESIYQHKTISYLQNLVHKTLARKRGVDDAVILNHKKEVLETTTANLFFIQDDEIITPPRNLPLLNGIMRQNLLSLQTIKNYRVCEKTLTKGELKNVEAAFITSAIIEIQPVKKIEDKALSVDKAEEIREEWLRIRRTT